MKDDIKEILNEIKILNGNVELGYEKSQILLDYITNLQEENKRLKSDLECYENGVYFSSENDKLQEENERLNNIINELEKELDYEIKDYNGDIDVETRNIDGEFLRGNAWEADYLKARLKELKENK